MEENHNYCMTLSVISVCNLQFLYSFLQSLTSGELGSLSGSEGCNRCRVILPDLSNSVVAVRPGESIQGLLTRLLERRGISYSTFDVYQHKSDKVLTYNLM